ncbi:MFS transporter [Mycolicibacterium sediminis]|uniref:MFS transporter n=1 Tax=Mycolicibacterium sediminis TaxID=1286180 RepID=A0A7I7QU02_9MYCO|nr:MFS transporter [Mycolicibacterium sediminis]BBY29858.1 MFS transporter [Mycolicibacterium sediminis]
MTETAARRVDGWRDLLGRRYGRASTVLAGGVALYATNEFLTVSLLPSAVADIGGQRFYAWVTTVYLVASVITATTVSATLSRLGARWSYLSALGGFTIGSALCALAPSMEFLLVGRVVQGAAGGLLAGLGYAVINSTLPQSLWTKASALVSAMWGLGTIVGPASGGLFAQYLSWRWAFVALAILTVLVAVLVPFALPSRSHTPATDVSRVPVWSLLLLGAAALVVSAAGVARNAALTAGLLTLGVALVGAFLIVDRRASATVLPATAFRAGPLKWIYPTLGLLMAATMVDMYVPLFGQRLAGLAPVAAGFLAVSLSVGWTVSEISSASVRTRRRIPWLVAAAPLVMASGLTIGAVSMTDGAGVGVVAIWAAALFVTGIGVGIAWPHLSAWAMGSVRDPVEGRTAAAAISTVQLICGAFGAGLAGVVVNATERGDATAARWLFATFAALAIVGVTASYRASRAGL